MTIILHQLNSLLNTLCTYLSTSTAVSWLIGAMSSKLVAIVAESSDANIPILMSNQSSTADEDEEDIVEQRNPLACPVDIDEIGNIVEKRKNFCW